MPFPDRVLRITKLAVIESLRPCDGHTGENLAREVADAQAAVGFSIAIQVLRCQSPEGFCQVIAMLTHEAKVREHFPVLHIECHGDDLHGLEFADGRSLSWNALMDVLRPLNEATELGLIVSVAACFGLGATRGLDIAKPAPCFALIGPSSGIWSNELFGALKDFYLDLTFRTTTAIAVENLRAVKLASGGFEVITVRQWFRLVMMCYLDNNTSIKKRREQALRQYQQGRKEGLSLDMSYWKKHFIRTLPTLLRGYHQQFFMVDRFPNHAMHFAAALHDMEAELQRRGFAN